MKNINKQYYNIQVRNIYLKGEHAMKEVQNELLKELREKVERSLTIIDEALQGQSTYLVKVNGVIVKRRKLETFYNVLKKISKTSDIEELKSLLYAGVAPTELVVVSRFWERLQKVIDASYKELKMRSR